MVIANANILRVSIEAKMDKQGVWALVKNEGFPKKHVLVTRCAFTSTCFKHRSSK